VLNKVPKSIQNQVKHDLRQVWTAPDRTTADKAIDVFAEKYGPKYDKAVQCLVKGPGPPARLLRLPSRAMGSHQNDQPY
jgi:transposase-like protein